MPLRRECTVMFYMASDNPLAISVVSQLKAIKAAGFHKDVNVIVQFDPFTEGTPTHIFDVNLINKLKSHSDSKIGFDGDDSFVRNMIEDKLWGKETGRNKKKIRDEIKRFVPGYNPPEPPNGKPAASNGTAPPVIAVASMAATMGANTTAVATINTATTLAVHPPNNPGTNGTHKEVGAQEGLDNFLKFCQKEYPANHYFLFILGHGVVVGNDVFLFDENAVEHSLTLGGLHKVLCDFKQLVEEDRGKFDLVGFHSCSVSSLEVAYELRDTAKYMLASQGTAFVGSWPYRQILVRIFKDVKRLNKLDDAAVKNLLVTIFRYCLHNSTDFLLAGYPFDLCLCDLSEISQLDEPLKNLSETLKEGLDDNVGRNLILLAHWRAQSFYKEMYTDLADFCFCLQREIRELPESITALPDTAEILQRMSAACTGVLDLLAKEPIPDTELLTPPPPSSDESKHIIIGSEFAGPEYQYANGLSVYFPWAEPSKDRAILDEYQKYELSSLSPSWFEFLNDYFEKTKRKTRRLEQDKPENITDEQALLEDEFSLIYGQAGPTGSENALDQSSKTDPKDATGGDCGCPSIKNYPRDTRGRRQRLREPTIDFSVGKPFLRGLTSA